MRVESCCWSSVNVSDPNGFRSSTTPMVWPSFWMGSANRVRVMWFISASTL